MPIQATIVLRTLRPCEDEKVDAYVPDQQYRKRDVRFNAAYRHRRSTDKRHQRYKSKKRYFNVDDFIMTEQRQVHILYEKPRTITDRMKDKIDTPEGRKTYSKRLGIVEPVFGNIRSCKKMDRFTLRGKVKVTIQWKLYCLMHNIEKILNYGKSFAIA